MKRKRLSTILLAGAVCMTLLGACGKEQAAEEIQPVEGLEDYGTIKVITREEGSGTRAVFAEQLGMLGQGSGSSNSDLITENAEIEMNAEAVMDAVREDRTAIGYVSYGALPDNLEGVKIIQIGGVLISAETIQDGSYPLSRDFNIAYSGELSDAENDFITYMMGAGQEIVAENYVSVKKAVSFLSDQSNGTIRINGSTSVEPLMTELAEAYQEINQNVTIEVNASDSTSGLTAAMQGSCDFGMSSRDLKDYEKELLTYQTIARDGIAVIVNEENPVETLTSSQLAAIYMGEDTEWIDINQ